MRILFVSSNRIGDAVITCGVLDHLIRACPRCRITVVCGPAAVGVFARMPNRERTIVLDKRRFDLHWLALWRQVAFIRWDLVVDLRGSGLAYTVPARKRAVRRRVPGRMFEQYAAVLDIRPAPLPVVWTAEQDRALAARLLPDGRPVIGLGATANWAPKVWPAERFAALFRRLAAEPFPGAVAAVFAGPGEPERAMAAPLLQALPGAVDLCGKLSLPEAAACLQRCALYVGNDSGLTHLAAAAGTPTIGLCGTTIDRAEEMVPAGRLADWALAHGPSMDALSVADAFAAVARLLALGRAADGGRRLTKPARDGFRLRATRPTVVGTAAFVRKPENGGAMRRRGRLIAIAILVATLLPDPAMMAARAQVTAPADAWLFGSWTGGLFPAPTGLTAEACLAQPVVIFTRDLVLRATMTEQTYAQRTVTGVRRTSDGFDLRFAASGGEAGGVASVLGLPTPPQAEGFGCESPDVLHVQRRGDNEITFPAVPTSPTRWSAALDAEPPGRRGVALLGARRDGGRDRSAKPESFLVNQGAPGAKSNHRYCDFQSQKIRRHTPP